MVRDLSLPALQFQSICLGPKTFNSASYIEICWGVPALVWEPHYFSIASRFFLRMSW